MNLKDRTCQPSTEANRHKKNDCLVFGLEAYSYWSPFFHSCFTCQSYRDWNMFPILFLLVKNILERNKLLPLIKNKNKMSTIVNKKRSPSLAPRNPV